MSRSAPPIPRRRHRSTALSGSVPRRPVRPGARAWKWAGRGSSSTPVSRERRNSRSSTTLPSSSTRPTSTRPRRGTSASRSTTSSTPRTRSRSLSGARSACGSSTSSTSRRSRSPELRVTVAGAGMAGLVAAARLHELGHEPRVLEKGTRAGGSMLLSSCVVWRHLEWDRFRAECPGGDESLQRLIWERLDESLGWLESLGAEPVWRDTENPLTTGRRFDPGALTGLLLEAAGGVELETLLPGDVEAPLLLSTGGFPGRLARERGLLLRANPWSEGDGLDFAVRRGGATTPGMDEFYGRVMPAPPARIREEDFVPLAQLYGGGGRVLSQGRRGVTPPPGAWGAQNPPRRARARGGGAGGGG